MSVPRSLDIDRAEYLQRYASAAVAILISEDAWAPLLERTGRSVSTLELEDEWVPPHLETTAQGEPGIQWTLDVPVKDLRAWQVDATIEALKLEQLKDDWDSYGSPPPSRIAIEAAENIIKKADFDALPKPDVVPVSGGGIQFEWNIGVRELEISIDHCGSLSILEVEDGEVANEIETEGPPWAKVKTSLIWLLGA